MDPQYVAIYIIYTYFTKFIIHVFMHLFVWNLIIYIFLCQGGNQSIVILDIDDLNTTYVFGSNYVYLNLNFQ